MHGVQRGSDRPDSGAPPTTRSVETYSAELAGERRAASLAPAPAPAREGLRSGKSGLGQALLLVCAPVFIASASAWGLARVSGQGGASWLVIGQIVGAVLGIGAGVLGARWLAQEPRGRIDALTRAASRVAEGHIDEPELSVDGDDEVAEVTQAFNTVLRQMRVALAKVERAALEEQRRVDEQLRARTHERDAIATSLALVLQGMGQGFVTLARDGTMESSRSAMLESWLGPAPASGSFADYLGAARADVGARFRAGWAQVALGDGTHDVALDQLPKSIEVANRVLRLSYRALRALDGSLVRVVVVLTDVTAEADRERAEVDARELAALCLRLLQDREAVLELCDEVERMLAALGEPMALHELQHRLHRLEENADRFGLDSVAALCRTLEESLLRSGALTPEAVAPLRERWGALSGKLAPLFELERARPWIERADLVELARAIESGAPRSALSALVEAFWLEPVHLRLSRLGERASHVARQLGRAPLELQIEASKLRLGHGAWDAVWPVALDLVSHLVDHDIESADERRRAGKPPAARLRLSAELHDEQLVLEVSGDGRGLDWEAIADRACALGLSAGTPSELVEALFAAGAAGSESITTAGGLEASLTAARAACQSLGGCLELESRRGRGTTVRLLWPLVTQADQRRGTWSPPVSHCTMTGGEARGGRLPGAVGVER